MAKKKREVPLGQVAGVAHEPTFNSTMQDTDGKWMPRDTRIKMGERHSGVVAWQWPGHHMNRVTLLSGTVKGHKTRE